MIDVLPLLPELNTKLITLLRSLTPAQWQLPTVARLWKVKDVATHLLDGNLRRISVHRDGWQAPPEQVVNSYTDLVEMLNRLNADWVRATRRLSPAVLIDMLDWSNRVVYDEFRKLDLQGQAVWPVSWAGEAQSQNWMDLAREYTERWLHQQQIRDAIGDEELLSAEFYRPLLDIFVLAWPFTMNDSGSEGQTVALTVSGNGGGDWYLQKKAGGKWRFVDPVSDPVAHTRIDGAVAWKLFSKSLRKEEIPGLYEVRGDLPLGEKVLNMISVMA